MKRGTMPLVALITILLLVIGGIYIAYIMYNGLRDSTSTDVTQLVPGIPQDIPKGVAVVAPNDVHKAFDDFVGLLEADKGGPCIQTFDWSKLKDFQVEMQIDDAGTLFILRNKDGQFVTSTPAKGQMCVVAGKINTDIVTRYDSFGRARDPIKVNDDSELKLAAYNFYTNWIGKIEVPIEQQLPIKQGVPLAVRAFTPDYSVPEKIVITSPTAMSIRFTDGTEMSTGKEDGGLLYVPEKGKVCLFGTKSGDILTICDADENGLDNDCLLEEDEGLKPQINTGVISYCG